MDGQLYAGSRSRYGASDFLQDNHPPLPYTLSDSSQELSIAYGARGVGKLHQLLAQGLSETDTVLALNLLVRQLPQSADEVVRTGCLREVVLPHVDHASADIRYEAARIVASCAFLPSGALEIAGALPSVFRHAGEDAPRTMTALVRASCLLCANSTIQQHLAEPEQADVLSALLASVPASPSLVEAVSLLAAAGSAPMLLRLGAQQVLATALSDSLATGGEAVSFFCLAGLRSLAAVSDDAKEAVLQAGAGPLVLDTLDHPSSRVRGASVGLLALLVIMLSGTHAAMAGGPSIVNRLIKLIHDGNRQSGATAKACVRTLVAQREGRAVFIEALLYNSRTLVGTLEHRASGDLVALVASPDRSVADKEAALKALLEVAEGGEECLKSIADAPGVLRLLMKLRAGAESPGIQESATALLGKLAAAFADMDPDRV